MAYEPTPLDFLKAVYLNEALPLSVRMRAASEAAPYMHAKLTAVALASMNPAEFARQLERAISRSNTVRVSLPPPTIIDAEPVED